jgi:hypothetical protein
VAVLEQKTLYRDQKSKERPARSLYPTTGRQLPGHFGATRGTSAEQIANGHETFAIFIVEEMSSIKNSVINKELSPPWF